MSRRKPTITSSSSSSSSSLSQRPQWVGVGEDSSAAVLDRPHQSAIRLNASAADHVAAYIEYDRIVGDADGGRMFSPAEYEEFKTNAIAHRTANRIYVSWRNQRTGMDCRQIGPSSQCFCGHRYKQHATDNTSEKKIFCRQGGCPCKLFDYIPVRGTQDVKCTCKHSYDTHNVTGARKCKMTSCSCSGFHTSLSCSCQDQCSVHATVFETREEREAQGRPVDNLAGGGAGYEALGGITSYSSLIDGIDRMQIGPSGVPELVGAPSSSSSHPSADLMLSSKKKLSQDEEFAAYEQKYKKGGSAANSVRSRIGIRRTAEPSPFPSATFVNSTPPTAASSQSKPFTPTSSSVTSSMPPRNRLSGSSNIPAAASPFSSSNAPASSSSSLPRRGVASPPSSSTYADDASYSSIPPRRTSSNAQMSSAIHQSAPTVQQQYQQSSTFQPSRIPVGASTTPSSSSSRQYQYSR